jgi:hypothetical protein
MILTTHKSSFTELGDALHDHDMADVIVDRVITLGRHIFMVDPSFSARHLILDQQAPACSSGLRRVSRIGWAEFPKPAKAKRHESGRTQGHSP